MLRIGKQLRRLRVERGLTHRDIADAIGITTTAVSRLETNASSPSGTNLAKLADFFRVPMDELRDEGPAQGPEELEVQLIDAAQRAQGGDAGALAEMRRISARLAAADAARTALGAERKTKSSPKQQ